MAVTIKRRQLKGDVFDPALPSALDRVLRARGISRSQQIDVSARNLLHFKDLKDIQVAASLLSQAIKRHQKIMLIGDFDADGATSTALCMLGLSAMGAKNIAYLVPNRFNFGYGLSEKIVDAAYEQGAEVIVTVDSGIACFEGVEKAKALGLTVVITDHHLPASALPNADAIVNPNQPGCAFESKHLAGVGVAFYVLSALKATLSEQHWFKEKGIKEPNMAQWLDIVAIGTVADVVPLDQNNRILVYQGLQRIRAGRCRPAITAMLQLANRPVHYLSAADLGFVIGPRLNAAGRLEDMALGIECLLTDDLYQARELTAQLDQLNQTRKHIEQEMREEAQSIVSSLVTSTDSVPNGFVVYDASFHQGVIGIVAGRLKDTFNRPTVTFAKQDEQTLKGSARSIAGVHIRDVLEAIDKSNPSLIDKFGGHAMAAGLSLPIEHLEHFKQAFDEMLAPVIEALDTQDTVYTDGALDEADFSLDFALLLKQSGPFGQGFEAPCFDNEFTLLSQRIVGEHHLKLDLATSSGQRINGIAFNVDTNEWPNNNVDRIHAVYSPDINVFRNKTNLQLIISHLQPC
jgi:single-stranded-DNA-specific exonuclease